MPTPLPQIFNATIAQSMNAYVQWRESSLVCFRKMLCQESIGKPLWCSIHICKWRGHMFFIRKLMQFGYTVAITEEKSFIPLISFLNCQSRELFIFSDTPWWMVINSGTALYLDFRIPNNTIMYPMLCAASIYNQERENEPLDNLVQLDRRVWFKTGNKWCTIP